MDQKSSSLLIMVKINEYTIWQIYLNNSSIMLERALENNFVTYSLNVGMNLILNLFKSHFLSVMEYDA